MHMKNFGHPDPEINSHDATESRPRSSCVRHVAAHSGLRMLCGSHNRLYGVMRFLLRPSTHAFRGAPSTAQCFPCLVE
jgi:hypothetical protein